MATDNVQFPVNRALTRFQQAEKSKHGETAATGAGGSEAAPQTRAAEDVFTPSEHATQRQETLDLHAVATRAYEEAPDVRDERIAEVRERILNGDLDSEKVREQVAQSLERVMGILDLFVS